MSREGKAAFPRRQPDGTFSVGARLLVRDAASKTGLEQYVRSWPRIYYEGHGIDAADEFAKAPQLVTIAPDTLEVVFDGTAESRLWKDLMVHLVQHIPPDIDVRFLGFHDRVADRVHPGSMA